jgi:hypothetical protein
MRKEVVGLVKVDDNNDVNIDIRQRRRRPPVLGGAAGPSVAACVARCAFEVADRARPRPRDGSHAVPTT